MELTKLDILRIYGNQFWHFSDKVNFPENVAKLHEKIHTKDEIITEKVIPSPENFVETLPKEKVEIVVPKEEIKIPVAPIIKEEKQTENVTKVEILQEKPITPPPVTPILAPKSPFEGTQKIVWKMKKQSKLALVMEEDMFQNTLLMKALRVFLVEEIGINADLIGFGLFPSNAQNWNFEDMPTPFALLFGGKDFSNDTSISINSKSIFLTFSLTEIVLDRNKQAAAKIIITEAKKAIDGL